MSTDAPFILALDISKTRTGVCEGRVGSKPTFYSITGNDMTNDAAAMRLGQWLIARTKVDKPDCVYIEAAINPGAFIGEYDEEKGRVRMTSNPETTLALAEMAAVARFVLSGKDIAWRNVKVQTIRKAFIGHGNLKGQIAKARVRHMCGLLGWEPNNTDESDAGAVWWFGGMQFAPKHYQPVTPMMIQKVSSIGGSK